jgi:glutamyl-tRNA synthetase
VWRFKNPPEGQVTWEDKVKGSITIANSELDDLVVARADGMPTYNFCVVVDDIDMQITHVIRGDDHVNNTPRQINLFRALGCEPPIYAHLPTVLNEVGEKMSKRAGAKAITVYKEEGFLSQALVNYLARLGWSHGNDEIFTPEQLIAWFDLDHLGKSAAQFDPAKLRWVNAQHLKAMPNEQLAQAVLPFLLKQLVKQGWLGSAESLGQDSRLPALCGLFKDRSDTLEILADWLCPYFCQPPAVEPAAWAKVCGEKAQQVQTALGLLAEKLQSVQDWQKEAIAQAIKGVLQETGLKMPQLAMPARLVLMGREHTPSLDAVLALFVREEAVKRLQSVSLGV